jgi:type VI secretion system protein VasL
MTQHTDRTLKTGGDPRALADYAALREELSKLSHPARPDVDWQRVEQLSLSLFRQNGVELQTAAWYTLARTHQAGMYGLNEGLAILDALLTHQWGALWPQPVHARIEILASLCQRLQAILRTLSLSYADLPLVYQAEEHLNGLRDVLQRLELKNASQIGELCSFMHNAAVRLENADAGKDESAAVVLPAAAGQTASPEATLPAEPLVYVARQEPVAPRIVTEYPKPQRRWQGFAAGVLVTLLLGGGGLWGWQKMYPAAVPPLPVVANETTLKTLEQQSPLWLVDYGFDLAARAEPQNTAQLRAQWQQHLTASALPEQNLVGWHQGMEQLAQLAARLNELDEKRGKYITVSELKSFVFSTTQSFSQAIPLEEQLRRLSQEQTPQPALRTQIDTHLQQVIARYGLIAASQRQ